MNNEGSLHASANEISWLLFELDTMPNNKGLLEIDRLLQKYACPHIKLDPITMMTVRNFTYNFRDLLPSFAAFEERARIDLFANGITVDEL